MKRIRSYIMLSILSFGSSSSMSQRRFWTHRKWSWAVSRCNFWQMVCILQKTSTDSGLKSAFDPVYFIRFPTESKVHICCKKSASVLFSWNACLCWLYCSSWLVLPSSSSNCSWSSSFKFSALYYSSSYSLDTLSDLLSSSTKGGSKISSDLSSVTLFRFLIPYGFIFKVVSSFS